MCRKLFLLTSFVLVFAFSTMAMASDIAFYVGQWNIDGWYGAEQFDHVETIITETGHLFKDIRQFDDTEFDAFGAWVDENTNDGELDIIWLNGCTPSVLYPNPNEQPDGSRAEEWLDGGNMIINVGDWFAYCTYEGGPRGGEGRGGDNAGDGAANILDLSSGIIVGADGTQAIVTPTGKEYLPSLNDPAKTDRPVILAEVQAPWEVAAIFASGGGTEDPAVETGADPVVIHNTETDGYVAFINQASGGPDGWITDRGLTSAEFIGNWVNNVIGLAAPDLPDLLAWWTCDEGAGTVVGDASGNGNDGTFVNGDPAWVEGIRGNAVELVGPTLIEVPPLYVELTEATMAGWIKPNGAQPDWSSIIMTRTPGLATGFNVLGYQLAYHWNDTSDSWSFRGGDMIAEDDWTFAAVTIEPDKATFYVNGVAGSVNEISHGPCIWNSNIYLGGDGTESWIARRMNGALDDVSLFSRALTADEILAAMEGIEPPAANIVWVTVTSDDAADGAQDDQAWIDWLVAEGHNVDARLDYWTELDASKVDELNAADLVIVSRSTHSGDFTNDDETTLWNSVTSPLILMNVYIARSSRWMWMDTTSQEDADDILVASDPAHPLFDGVSFEMDNLVIFLDNTVGSGMNTFIGSIDVGNGTLIAQRSSVDQAWIAEWEAGVEFYAGSGQTAGGPRMLFAAGTMETTDPPTPQGAWNLTADGEIIFRNAVNSMLPAVDVTASWDNVVGVPDDGDWPGAETPDLAIDNNIETKYLHFKGDFDPDPGTGGAGFQVTPSAGLTIVTGLTFTTANDVPGRDPIAFKLSGSNEGIDGPYELIASGDIVDFAQEAEWPRFTKNATPISFDNDVAYAHYQIIFTAIRGPVGGSVNSMQIAEVELLGELAPPGPIVHYKLDDGEGTIAVDSANGLDGILMGDPQWSAGILDGALDFDGDGDYVDCGGNAEFSLTDAMTVSTWVNIRSVTGAWMAMVAKGENAWRFGVNNLTTGIHYAFTGSARDYQAANSAIELPLDEWHHIAATYDINVGALVYIDGVLDAENTDTGGIQTNDMPLLLGDNPEATGRFFDGLLDDVRIYDRALSAAEISKLASPPPYVYDGGALDDTWDHDNGSDAWDGTGPGEGMPGGAGSLTEDGVTFLRIQDTGDPRDYGMSDPTNRKVYLTHLIDGGLDGAKLEFRIRVATSAPLDDLHPDGGAGIEPWPADGIGYHIRDDGKGMIGIGEPDMEPISFSLAKAGEPGFEDVATDVLVMNNLVGDTPSDFVDTEDAASAVAVNMVAVDDVTQWHTFTIDITAGGAGTHIVTVSVDGGPAESFEVTAGTGGDVAGNYIALGSSGTGAVAAFDVDYISVQ